MYNTQFAYLGIQKVHCECIFLICASDAVTWRHLASMLS